MVKGSSPLWKTRKEGTENQGGLRFPVEPDSRSLPQIQFPYKSDSGGTGAFEHFTIFLIYEDDSVEEVPIMARDADDALNRALDVRKTKNLKVKTCMVQDSLKEAVSKLVTGVGKAGAVAAQTVGRVGRATGRVVGAVGHAAAEVGRGVALGTGKAAAAYQSFKREYHTGRLERLIMDAASDSPARRAMAKYQLKKEYPKIYKHIAWLSV